MLRLRNCFKLPVCCCILFFTGTIHAQSINDYFEKIRNNEAALTAFMAQMPKGGDLHNHYSGAVYGETYLRFLKEAGYCINPVTLQINDQPVNGRCDSPFYKYASLQSPLLDDVNGRLLRSWSTKDYDQVHNDVREDHFFATFGNFGVVSWLNYGTGLQELKQRAIAENVSYIETMLTRVSILKQGKPAITNDTALINSYNRMLWDIQQNKDSLKLQALLKTLYENCMQNLPLDGSAAAYNRMIDSLHDGFKIDDQRFTMRYQTFIARTQDPLTTFINLLLSFRAVNYSQFVSGRKLLVGLNIVAPEDNPVSMRDYWLHMQFFAFCNNLYNGKIHYSMHAGELTEGYVQPEQLTYHISDAVRTAGANRIGHGVDIAYEKKSYELLSLMSKAQKNIPVEINLSSNEFILGVKDDKHPIMLYRSFGVPIVISTDDPGVSRSSLTEQYVLLAKRYPKISYAEIKSYAFNSIEYSFMSDIEKQRLKEDLAKRFEIFENYALKYLQK